MLELKNINVSFRSERQDKIFGHTRQQVLFDVSLAVKEGTCLGILGESGSGKSTMGRVLCGLLKPDSGEAVLDGVSVYASRAGRRNLQNKLSIVFQDYTTSANPRFRIRDIIGEGLTVQERREGKKLDRKAETSRLLELVGLPADFADRFPHELSGGQLQRVCIARAVACKPEIILFDEAISSLDAHTQVQVMDLLRELKDRLGLTYIFITHDLGVVANVADRVAVMYAGQIVEYGTVEEIFYDAWHPYTWALLQALPQLGTKGEALPTIDGTPPNLFNEIKGDAFAPRNKHALAIDFVQEPPFFQVSETHAAKTWYLDPRAPKIERPHSIQNLREKMGKMGGANLNG